MNITQRKKEKEEKLHVIQSSLDQIQEIKILGLNSYFNLK